MKKKIIILSALFLSMIQIDASSTQKNSTKQKQQTSTQQNAESQDQKNMIQDFIQKVAILPIKDSQVTKKSKFEYKQNVEKAYQAYKKLFGKSKNIKVTQSEKETIDKAVQDLRESMKNHTHKKPALN